MDIKPDIQTYGLSKNQVIKRVSIKLPAGVIWDKSVLPAHFGELEDFIHRDNYQPVSVLFISNKEIKSKTIKNGIILQHYICNSTNYPLKSCEALKDEKKEFSEKSSELEKMIVIVDKPMEKVEFLEQIWVVALDGECVKTMPMSQINKIAIQIQKFIMSNFLNCNVSIYPLNLMSYIKLKNPILGSDFVLEDSDFFTDGESE